VFHLIKLMGIEARDKKLTYFCSTTETKKKSPAISPGYLLAGGSTSGPLQDQGRKGKVVLQDGRVQLRALVCGQAQEQQHGLKVGHLWCYSEDVFIALFVFGFLDIKKVNLN
jgi:hypothetical protein